MTDRVIAIVQDGQLQPQGRPHTAVPWWSFGKTVLAAAALKLADEGRLALDDPDPGEAYTLRQLLQHRAGLRDYGELADYHAAVARGDPPWTRHEMLQRTSILPKAPPGAIWAYSNIGYMRVADRIAAAADAPLEAALRRLVFEPLGIEGVSLGGQAEALDGYDPGWVYHGLLVGPAGSAALLLDRLLAGRLLSPAALAAMQAYEPLPQFAGPVFAEPSYGLGLMAARSRLGPFVRGHSGGGPGSVFAVYGAGARTVAVFARSEDASLVEQAAVEALAETA